eukprot:191287_1
MSCLSDIDLKDLLTEHWYYHISVSVFSCVDFILSIIMLIEVNNYDGAWFAIMIVILAISRLICSVFPFLFYTSTTPKMEPTAICWRLYSAFMLFFFSPFHSLYHAGFNTTLLIDLLRLRERKNYLNLNYNKNHSSKFQDWVNNAVKIHCFHSYPHCISQAMPNCIVYFSLIVYEQLSWKTEPFIITAFFINLFAIIIVSPIWTSRLYYGISIGRDHYHIWTFIFNILAKIIDFLLLIYIIGYLIEYIPKYGMHGVKGFPYSYSVYGNMSAATVIYSLWYYEFMFVLLVSIVCVFFIGNVTSAYILWDVFKRMNSFRCQDICGGCLTIAYAVLVSSVAAIQFILWILNAALTLQISCLSWISVFSFVIVSKFGNASHQHFWCDMVLWVKKYENKNDLILRICCCNYHLRPELKQIIEKGIINKCYENPNVLLGFRDIRINSDLIGFSWFQFINKLFENVISMPKVISISLRLCLLVFSVPYIITRVILIFLPLIGFVIFHYNDWGHYITLLSFIYSIFLIFILCLIDKVLWHLWILMHICPGVSRIECGGLHNTCMPSNDTLYAILESYTNITTTIKYKMELKAQLCKCIILNEYHKNDDNTISIAPLKIVYVIIKYLPNNSMYVDYPKIGTTDNLEKPLLESVDTEMFMHNIGTV